MRAQLLIGRQSGEANSKAVSVERLVNGYLELTPEGKEPAPVYGIPGLVTLTTTPGPNRGEFTMADELYAVGGNFLYRVSSTGAQTNLGEIDPGDMVDMATDGTNLVIVTPETGHIWIYNGSVLGRATDGAAGPASSVDWVDGYFVFGEKDTDLWFICELGDPFNFDPLAFAAAEWRPDKLVRPLVAKRDVFLMGQQSVEAFRNTGSDPIFPFERLDNVFIDVGLIGKFAATFSNDAIFFLASDLTVRRLDGSTATPLQTPAIAKEIASWADPSLTKAHAHVWGDHLFITFVNPDGCIVWDQRTQRWHERESWDRNTWRARTMALAYGKILFGDGETGAIYAMDAAALDEGGERIVLDMIWPYVFNKGARFTTNSVEVIMEVGTAPTYTRDPVVQLCTTNDGQLWSAWRERTLGGRGDYQARIVWNLLGQARQRAYRLRISDPCRRVVLSAYADLEADDG